MGLDSVELVMAFEEHFGVEFSDAEAAKLISWNEGLSSRLFSNAWIILSLFLPILGKMHGVRWVLERVAY